MKYVFIVNIYKKLEERVVSKKLSKQKGGHLRGYLQVILPSCCGILESKTLVTVGKFPVAVYKRQEERD